jgi:hypothetical protein
MSSRLMNITMYATILDSFQKLSSHFRSHSNTRAKSTTPTSVIALERSLANWLSGSTWRRTNPHTASVWCSPVSSLDLPFNTSTISNTSTTHVVNSTPSGTGRTKKSHQLRSPVTYPSLIS